MRATITSKGQITLPKALRTKMGLKPGDEVVFLPHNDSCELRKTRSIHELAGILGKPKKTVTLEEIDEAVRQHAVQRFLRSTKE
jgi:antitoxin PrlF